jgi:hypothetical protein
MKWKIVCIIIALAAAVSLSGCIEEEQTPQAQTPIWGQGDLPPQWVEYFDDDNKSRLDFKQSLIIDELTRRVRTLEINQYIPDPNE